MNYFALTIIGRDRTGIVAQVTDILYRLGCNIADSSSTILGGQFAMILIIAHPEFTEKEDFGDAFAALEEDNLSVFLRSLSPGGEKRPSEPGEICMISVYGSDKPGIVFRITRELSARGINIIDMNSKRIGSDERPVYAMMLETVLPADLSIDELTEAMKGLQEELQVDISVRSITPVEL